MRQLLVTVLVLVGLFAFAGAASTAWSEESAIESEIVQVPCPATPMQDNCLSCHAMTINKAGKIVFGLKAVNLDELYVYPNSNTKIRRDSKTGELYGIVWLGSLNARNVKESLDFLFLDQGLNRVVFNVDSYGGGVFEGWGIVNEMMIWQDQKKIIETRCTSMAFSGGFFIFVSGSKGYRHVSPSAYLMWHEIQTLSWGISWSSTSQDEDDAVRKRGFQDDLNGHIAKQSKLTKEEIDAKVRRVDWYLRGKEAVELGLADNLLTIQDESVKNVPGHVGNF